LSGDLTSSNIVKTHTHQQNSFFPENNHENPWTLNTMVKRYYLNFPFYPFRTLGPRDLKNLAHPISEFDPTSPLFPAHTQINLTFHKRDLTNFLPYMLPYNLNQDVGSEATMLTLAQRNTATLFNENWNIQKVNIAIQDIALQVNPPGFFLFFSS
jgi:hypothetical protein